MMYTYYLQAMPHQLRSVMNRAVTTVIVHFDCVDWSGRPLELMSGIIAFDHLGGHHAIIDERTPTAFDGAIQHLGEFTTQSLRLELDRLPEVVSQLYLVLTATDAEMVQRLHLATIRIVDASNADELGRFFYGIPGPLTRGLIVGRFERFDGHWYVVMLGATTGGTGQAAIDMILPIQNTYFAPPS